MGWEEVRLVRKRGHDGLKNLDFSLVSRIEALTIFEDGVARVSYNSQSGFAGSLPCTRHCRQCSPLDSEVLKSYLLDTALLILWVVCALLHHCSF